MTSTELGGIIVFNVAAVAATVVASSVAALLGVVMLPLISLSAD